MAIDNKITLLPLSEPLFSILLRVSSRFCANASRFPVFIMKIFTSSSPLWLVGFRPFFSLACLSGALLPSLWLLLMTGRVNAPINAFAPMQWHAHEMFFGFGWAIIGGFLLTASKNWVQIRGYHGPALMFLAFAWLQERLGMWFQADLPAPLFYLSNNLFLLTIVAMLMWTLVRHRKTDTYRDNYFFLAILPTFLVTKYLILSSDYFQIGISMAIGLFRVAFLVMLERTLSQFMKSLFQLNILRHPLLDKAIKLLALLMVFEALFPKPLVVLLASLLAGLLLFRFFRWAPKQGFSRIDLGVMYLGYLALVAQLLLLAFAALGNDAWVGTMTIHVFTLGVMGLIIPAMIVRIAKGHTGRKVIFETADKAVLWLMIAGFVSRVLVPQLFPDLYMSCLVFTAACWLLCFGLLGYRYIPYLLQARVDGKEH